MTRTGYAHPYPTNVMTRRPLLGQSIFTQYTTLAAGAIHT